MGKAKLNNGDMPFIAKILGIHKDTIRYIINGRRGKRGTELQDNIMEAVELRSKQNQELEKFCKRVRVERVVPTKVK